MQISTSRPRWSPPGTLARAVLIFPGSAQEAERHPLATHEVNTNRLKGVTLEQVRRLIPMDVQYTDHPGTLKGSNSRTNVDVHSFGPRVIGDAAGKQTYHYGR
ncbi:MAG: hypothetical protein H0X01_00735 [Nitrospira sp.]|nr:hypothetical protein [Nitrospira sp.]